METVVDLTRATSPGGSSATGSTTSSKFLHIFRKAPTQPECNDPNKWSKFLSAYQKGEWDSVSESTKNCSKSASKVEVEGGKLIDNIEFFSKFKYLAAPPLPKEKATIRRETLLRHGFTGPQIRPSVKRYVRHAKSVFQCDYVSVSVASADEKSTLFLGSEGSPCAHMIATNTVMCGHAMLLGEEEVFVVPDISEDWRFKNLLYQENGVTHGMNFYASAPILLTAQVESDEDPIPVHVGRLTIMRRKPWKDFGEEEAEILVDIARMTQEALENEYLQSYTKTLQGMQKEAAKLSFKINKVLDVEVFSQERARENQMGLLFDPSLMQVVIDTLRKVIKATGLVAIDASNLHLMAQPARSSTYSSSSPRTSSNFGASSSAYTWMSRSTSNTYSPLQETMSPSLGASSLTPSSEETNSQGYGFEPPLSEPGSPVQQKVQVQAQRSSARQHNRSSSSMFSYGNDEEIFNTDPLTPLSIICSTGDPAFFPEVTKPGQCSAVCSFFTALKRKKLYTKPQYYDLTQESESSDDEAAAADESSHVVKNTLKPILPTGAKLCVAIPVFSNDRTHPLILLVATWDHSLALLNAEKYFCYMTGVMLGGMAFRQQASTADRAQLDFIRSVQHELRTPLNGILGITDFLRQSLVNGDESEKLDLTQDGVLANLLESIRLAGVNLSTILDDVLDFGAVTGLSHSQMPRASTQIEEVDLEREVEDVCLDELEHISMRERQDKHLSNGYHVISNVPSLIIKVSPEVQSRFRTDRSKLRKILSKFVNNALRYTDENGLVEVIVQPSRRRDSLGGMTANGSSGMQVGTNRWIDMIITDNGVGMSKDFLSNSLLKPFSKADSFSQGVGLGVTIAASLITQLGGRFNVQSESGRGTCIQISLPLGVTASLRHPLPRRTSHLGGTTRPYQIRSAAFHGFQGEGQKATMELIKERLIQNDVQVVEIDRSPELLIIPESILFSIEKVENGSETKWIETPSSSLPRPQGSKARTLIVTNTALRRGTSSALDGQTVWFFRPPFGRDSLELMDEFLREESPVILKRIPTPTHSAEKNLNKIRENRTAIDKNLQQVPQKNVQTKGESVVQGAGSSDEIDSVTNSVNTCTTAVSTAPPPASPGLNGKQATILSPESMQKDQQLPSDDKLSMTATTPNPKPFRILVVEDNPVNMKLITTLLRREKHDFVEAKDGMEAVEQYKAFKPSIVLLDISLPLLDGFGACIQMRAHDLEHIPKIIAITALSSTEDKVRGLEECGMDDWRTKPLSIKTLRTDLVAWKRDWEDAWNGVEEQTESQTTTLNTTITA